MVDAMALLLMKMTAMDVPPLRFSRSRDVKLGDPTRLNNLRQVLRRMRSRHGTAPLCARIVHRTQKAARCRSGLELETG
jgi:hypothetical protein